MDNERAENRGENIKNLRGAKMESPKCPGFTMETKPGKSECQGTWKNSVKGNL